MIAGEDEARAFVAQRCDAAAMVRLDRLVEALRIENTRQNLVAAATLPQVWVRHIADSAQLLDHVPRETGSLSWIDLGSGAGFPGLVISAMRPDYAVVLVETRRRRIEWLEAISNDLQLTSCSVAGMRAETVPTFEAEVISARAFAPLPKLIATAQRFSTSGTTWLLPKGRSAAQEVAELPKAIRDMFHVEQSVTDTDAGIVVGRGLVDSSR